MVFEFKQLRCFVAVAEELHFGRAAERLNMTQPPLSRQISLLEHRLGLALIDRSSRQVKLTTGGVVFYDEAVRLLHLASDSLSKMQTLTKGTQGNLSIGFTASSGYSLLPKLVANLRLQCPDLSLHLREMVTHEQLEALHNGSIDAGIMRPHEPGPDLVSTLLESERLYLVAPAGWVVDSDLLSLQELSHNPLIMYSPKEAQYFHDVIARLLRQQRIQPRKIEYVSQIHTMLALVNAELGFAIIPAAARYMRPTNTVCVPLDIAHSRVDSVLTYQRGNDNPALSTFLSLALPVKKVKEFTV